MLNKHTLKNLGKGGRGWEPNADIADKGWRGDEPIADNPWKKGEGGSRLPLNMAFILPKMSSSLFKHFLYFIKFITNIGFFFFFIYLNMVIWCTVKNLLLILLPLQEVILSFLFTLHFSRIGQGTSFER